jgi:glycosyltransferase involved in cell wall biosynthesis
VTSTPGVRVSVLLPVRDAAATLGECLLSLRHQSLRDHEVVAVDDGSQDSSRSLLEKASLEDPRVRVLTRPPEGLVAALNAARDAARAPLLARMDADDVAHPDRLRHQVERLESDPDLDVLGCRVRLVGGRSNEGMRSYVDWSNGLVSHDAIARERFVESPFVHPSVIIRASTLDSLSGWRDFGGPEDYDLWLRAHEQGARFGKLEETLLDWRDAESRLTRCSPRYGADRFFALKLSVLARGPLASGGPVVVWGAGKIGKQWARALLRAGVTVRAFVEVDPRKIGQRVYGVPVVAVERAGGWPGSLHLAAVGQAQARERIRAYAGRLGLRDGHDLLAVA